MEQEPKKVIIRKRVTKKKQASSPNKTKRWRCPKGQIRDPKNPDNCIENPKIATVAAQPPSDPIQTIGRMTDDQRSIGQRPDAGRTTVQYASEQPQTQPQSEVVLDTIAPVPKPVPVKIRKPKLKKTNQKVKISPTAIVEDQPADARNAAPATTTTTEYDFLYPQIGDPEFSYKIASRKEFYDTQYDGTITDIKSRANQLCNTEFELMPHQLFVRNFLSVQTPYNGLLLYMGLGSGKTCSAIGIAEEMRLYIKQSGLDQEKNFNKTLIIAAPNVQDNFRVQLFNEDQLVEENGVWNIQSCVGNKLIREVNPTHVNGLSKTTLSNNIHRLVDKYYDFMGYSQFANYAEKTIYGDNNEYISNTELQIQNIKETFSNRLVIIDEVHNIRADDQETDKTKTKAVSKMLFYIVEHADNLRLVLLSATPMYDSYQEIIWLTNLLNVNDGRPKLREEDVFDRKGNFLTNGKERLQNKLTGYVSYVRGENPYTFPYRLYPSTFAPDRNKTLQTPNTTFTNRPIADADKLKFLEIYGTQFAKEAYQNITYNLMVNYIRGEFRQEDEQRTNFGYSALTTPLQALNFVFPSLTYNVLDKEKKEAPPIHDFVGTNGMNLTMDYVVGDREIYDFEYKQEILERYGRIFAPDNLPKYGTKIASIIESVQAAKGISIVYSQYIDGGLVPLALALEELGYRKHGGRSLFKDAPKDANGLNYVMITGNTLYSKDNMAALKAINAEANMDGKRIKVVLISFAGSEGLDYKNIRQIHIMDPWYNMNRLEQIIGRGVRNLSHCKLPFEERNVEIYLHAMYMNTDKESEECIDLYMYRLSEKKAIQIGKVTRLMKEISVDCLLNIKQHSLTIESLQTIPENNDIEIQPASLSNHVKFSIGDRAYSNTCDYMESCELKCIPDKQVEEEAVNKATYHQYFMESNQERILQGIRQLFKEQAFYPKTHIIKAVNAVKQYPIEQIYSTLTYMINNKNEPIIDKYGRIGVLVNRDNVYAFQPVEINNENISIYDRSVPIELKRKQLVMKLDNSHAAANDDTNMPPNNNTTTALAQKAPADDDMPEGNPIQIIDEYIRRVFTAPKEVLPKSEWDFYDFLRNSMKYLKEVHLFTDAVLKRMIVEHALESMSHGMVLEALHLSYHAKEDGDTVKIARDYFRKHSAEYSGMPCVPLAKDKETVYYLYHANTKQWKVQGGIKEIGRNFYRNVEALVANKYIGFYNAGVFRIKDLSNKKTKSAIVNQKGKTELISILNELFDIKLTGLKYPDVKTLEQNSVSAILEMIMRYYSDTNFFTPVEANESIINIAVQRVPKKN
jgi:Helicase conserved C-terminal domain